MARYANVLLDLGGVVFVGDGTVPGAVEAVARLRDGGIGVRFITNTTRSAKRVLLDKLRHLGLDAAPDDLFTPALAARHMLQGRVPHLLVHPDLLEDFEAPAEGAPADALVVGDAGKAFSYEALNRAFRVLEGGAEFLALAENRTFKDSDGALSLDCGPFVAALEYAAGGKAKVIGKPSADFFAAALASLDAEPDTAAMIGDDVESDVGGAMAAGLAGILVRTGKYKDGDETTIEPAPTATHADLAAAVDWLLEAP